ncbi:MAG TPA: hypothetical protein VF553_01865 [Pyrinomonadaceae bacterium]|jgi:hypothetical protein
MARKTSVSSNTKLVLALALTTLLGSCSREPSPVRINIRLEEFNSGVSFEEQMRLKVKNIFVGEISVKRLFKDTDDKSPPWTERYGSIKTSRKNIVIKNEDSLEELRQTLAAQDTDHLTVILEGDQDTIWRSLWGSYYDQWNQKTLEIYITRTPCDVINRIIYNKINSIVKEQAQEQGETDKHIDLDQLFTLLLRDEIEPYLAQLDKVKKEDPCFNTFQLYKSLTGEEIRGFGSGKYRLGEGLKGLLDPAIDALVDTSTNWTRYSLSVRVVGYTDLVQVRTEKIELRREETGIDDWSKIEKPLDVHYLGCSNDHLDGKNFAFIRLSSSEGKSIEQKISNNCELGAVRAYVTAVYILNKLGRDNVEYVYATGGPDFSSNKREDQNKRKINVEFIIRAARTDQ